MVEFDRVQQHLLALGFDEHLVTSYVKKLRTWTDKSGVEWTVERLKSLKLYFLHQLEGKKPIPPVGWATYQTRHRKVFKDPMVRMVFDLPNTGVSLLRKEGFVRLYQIFKLTQHSEKQTLKYMKAITLPYTGDPEAIDEAIKLIIVGVKDMVKGCSVPKTTLAEVPHWPLRLWSRCEKRAPYVKMDEVDGVKRFRLKSQVRYKIEAFNYIVPMSNDRALQGLWRRHAASVSSCIVGEGEALWIKTSKDHLSNNIPAGKIGHIQEGGCKLRTVANPLLVLQALGEPLKQKLALLSRDFPQVSTFSQSESHDVIASWLKSGDEIASYDLTSFTDRFPFQLQKKVLQLLLEMGYISLFDYEVFNTVVEKEWVLPNSQTVRWTVGQPLGFGPSFHLATITHLALMRGMGCRKCLIVGDDIVINDRSSAQRYEALMKSLGVEISLAKSLISNEFAEFCGKVISAEGVNPSIKLKPIIEADQIIQLIGYYGPRAFDFLSHSEVKLARKVKLPPDLGGLGQPLPGETYTEYLGSFNIDILADSCLRGILREALGLSNYGKLQEVFEWFEMFNIENGLGNPATRIVSDDPSIGSRSITTNGLFTHGRALNKVSTAFRQKPFGQITDDLVREILSSGTRIPEWVKYFYFDPSGYTTERRKHWGEILAHDIIMGVNNDGKPAHDSIHRFFKVNRKTGDSEAKDNNKE